MPKGEAIPLTACEHRRLYVLHSRNLRCGVYSAPHRGFFGIRTKFSYRHVAVEYHVDTGAPYGTACPLKALDAVAPNEIDLVETVLTRPGDPGFDPTIVLHAGIGQALGLAALLIPGFRLLDRHDAPADTGTRLATLDP